MSKKQEQSKKKLKTEVKTDLTKENKFEIKKIDDFQFKVYIKNIIQ